MSSVSHVSVKRRHSGLFIRLSSAVARARYSVSFRFGRAAQHGPGCLNL